MSDGFLDHARTGFCEHCWWEAARRQNSGDLRPRVTIYYEVLDEVNDRDGSTDTVNDPEPRP